MKNVSLPKDNKDSIPEPTKGLEGIVAADTTLSSVNGEKGILRYCGYNIDDLSLNTTFEEIICLLYDTELPNEDRLKDMTARIGKARVLPDEIKRMIVELEGKTKQKGKMEMKKMTRNKSPKVTSKKGPRAKPREK